MPTMEFDGKVFVPHPSGRLLTPYTLEMEREFQQVRSELARRYGVANRLNRVTVSTERDWIGIAASGHTYHELREALGLLGLADDDDLRGAGVRLFHLLMPVPVDEQQIRDFAHGLAEVLVVEEKNPTLELLVKSAMYDSDERPAGRRPPRRARRPARAGHRHARRRPPARAAAPAARRPPRRRRPAAAARPSRQPSRIPLTVNRTPFYCSGCPHNLSTRVPEGTLVGGGIGCHAMVALMEPERVGDIAGLTAMGNEGAQWIGMAPFVERDHLVQNLGDGTFFHSGSLAIRAAVAAGVDITYKLLYNGTVAMTGGQDPQGQMTVPEVVQSLLLEGVSAGHRHVRRPGQVGRRRLRAARRRPGRGARPHRADGEPGRAGRGPRRHRAAPRPALRGRAAPRPQPRHRRQAGLPRRHQRAGVRGLRRLRRQEQLPVRAAGRHGVRAQDPHPPDELQLRHVVPAGRLPGVRHRDRRRRAAAKAARPARRHDAATPAPACPTRSRWSRPTPSRCASRASAARA